MNVEGEDYFIRETESPINKYRISPFSKEQPQDELKAHILLATASGTLTGLALGIRTLPEINRKQICQSLGEVVDILEKLKSEYTITKKKQ